MLIINKEFYKKRELIIEDFNLIFIIIQFLKNY